MSALVCVSYYVGGGKEEGKGVCMHIILYVLCVCVSCVCVCVCRVCVVITRHSRV